MYMYVLHSCRHLLPPSFLPSFTHTYSLSLLRTEFVTHFLPLHPPSIPAPAEDVFHALGMLTQCVTTREKSTCMEVEMMKMAPFPRLTVMTAVRQDVC